MMADEVFTPEMCDGVKYKGTVTLRPMTFDERLELYETLGLDDVPRDDEKALGKYAIKTMRAIGKKSHEFIKGCDIERLGENPHKYADWAEVYSDAALTPLIVEVCKHIMGKITAVVM